MNSITQMIKYSFTQVKFLFLLYKTRIVCMHDPSVPCSKRDKREYPLKCCDFLYIYLLVYFMNIHETDIGLNFENQPYISTTAILET